MSGEKDETFSLLEWIDGTMRRDDEEAAEILRRLGQSERKKLEQTGHPLDSSTSEQESLAASAVGYTDKDIADYIRRHYPNDSVLKEVAYRLDPSEPRPKAKEEAAGRVSTKPSTPKTSALK